MSYYSDALTTEQNAAVDEAINEAVAKERAACAKIKPSLDELLAWVKTLSPEDVDRLVAEHPRGKTGRYEVINGIRVYRP